MRAYRLSRNRWISLLRATVHVEACSLLLPSVVLCEATGRPDTHADGFRKEASRRAPSVDGAQRSLARWTESLFAGVTAGPTATTVYGRWRPCQSPSEDAASAPKGANQKAEADDPRDGVQQNKGRSYEGNVHTS